MQNLLNDKLNRLIVQADVCARRSFLICNKFGAISEIGAVIFVFYHNANSSILTLGLTKCKLAMKLFHICLLTFEDETII
jgi:hypothetical protein